MHAAAECQSSGRHERAAIPVTVTGPGVLDVTAWRQKEAMTVNLVNLRPNPMMMKRAPSPRVDPGGRADLASVAEGQDGEEGATASMGGSGGREGEGV